jgi:hypothetical protein
VTAAVGSVLAFPLGKLRVDILEVLGSPVNLLCLDASFLFRG